MLSTTISTELEKSDPLVTVAIITYNQEKFIEFAINSVLEQDYSNIQLVICDDGSTDRTTAIIKQICSMPRHRQLNVAISDNNVNLGITGNCNRAVDLAEGEFIVFMGGDDVLQSDKISKQVKYLTDNPACYLVGHHLREIDSHGKDIGLHKSPIKKRLGFGAKDWIKFGMLAGAMSIMVRFERDITSRLHFDSRLKYSSDLKYFIDLLGSKRMWAILPDVLGSYRKHPESITSSKWDECVRDYEVMFEVLDVEGSFNKHCVSYGRFYQVHYGKGLRAAQIGKYKQSLKIFLQVIKNEPRIMKTYIRFFQSLFFWALKGSHK